MITGITLENFKAFKERQVIPIKPITLIFGPNSGGKSCIFRALAALKHVFETGGEGEPDRVDAGWSTFCLGGWQNMLHSHDFAAGIALGLRTPASRLQLRESSQEAHFSDLSFSEQARSTANEHRIWRITHPSRQAGDPVLEFIHTIGDQPLVHCIGRNREWTVKDASGLIQCLKDHFVISMLEWLFLQDYKKDFTREIMNLGAWMIDKLTKKNVSISPELLGSPLRIKGAIWNHIPGSRNDTFFEPRVWDEWSERPDWTTNVPEVLWGTESDWFKSLMKKKPLPDLWRQWAGSHHGRVDPGFDLLASWIHLDPVRERPGYPLDLGSIPDEPQARPWRRMLTNDSFRQRASDALSSLTRGEYRIGTRTRSTVVSGSGESRGAETTRSQLELCFVQKDGLSLSPHDLGYGISTLLPVVAALTTESGKLISIEQPELHLHPGMQAELGDLFIDAALRETDPEMEEGLANSRFLIETHSEHLILRLLRRIRETTEGDFDDWPEALREACPGGIRPSDVAVLYVEPGEEGATIKQLRVNELGEFVDEWPQGFFEERVREVL